MKKALAWIATLALLLTSMSGLATVSLTASAEQGTDLVIADFSTGLGTAVRFGGLGESWDESGQRMSVAYEHSIMNWNFTQPVVCSGLAFDYDVPEGTFYIGDPGWSHMVVCTYVTPAGETKQKNFQFGMTGIGRAELLLDEPGVIISLYNYCQGASGKVAYFDNLTYLNVQKTLDSWVFQDFSTDAANLANAGDSQIGINRDAEAGNLVIDAYSGNPRLHWTVAGAAYGLGFSFDYTVPDGGSSMLGFPAWGCPLNFSYRNAAGEEKTVSYGFTTLTGSGTLTILFPEYGQLTRIGAQNTYCDHGDGLTMDNFTTVGLMPSYVFEDFSDGARHAGGFSAWNAEAQNVTMTLKDGAFNWAFNGNKFGDGIAFEYDSPDEFKMDAAWGDGKFHLFLSYLTPSGEKKDKDLGINNNLKGHGRKEILFGEVGRALALYQKNINDGGPGYAGGGTVALDNFATLNPIETDTDRVIYDFDDGVKPTGAESINMEAFGVENGKLKATPSSNANENAFIMRFPQGSMAGISGITYDYDVPEGTWHNYETCVTYIGADGEEHTLTEQWGGKSNYAHTGKGTRTIGYSPEVMNGLTYFHMWSNQKGTIYFDNFRTLDARPSLAAKADEVVDSVKVTWDQMDAGATAAEIYTSTSAIDHAAFEAGTATGLTQIYSGAAAGSKTVTGVGFNTTLYVAAKFTVLGAPYYAYMQATTAATPVKVLYDFEDAAQANTAWGGGNAMGYAFDADHNGSGMMKIWDDPKWGYGYFVLGGDVGDFAGDAVKFYMAADSRGWGWNCTALYKDPTDGTNEEAVLWQYGGFSRGGYTTISLTGLSEEIRKNIYGFRFNCNNEAEGVTHYGWIDNVCVVNPIDVQAPKANLSFEVDNGALAAKWNVKDDTSAQDKITATVYAAKNAFTQDDLADLTGNGITQISTAVSGSYNAGARAYVGVLATDEAGQTSFECKGQSLVCAYETADVLADYARVENGGSREIVAYGGSNALHYYTTGASDYCNTYVLAPVGKLQGDAVQFDITIDNNGSDTLGLDQAWMMWVDADGHTQVSVIKQYTAEGSGVFSFDLTGLTAEQKAGFIGFRWNWGKKNDPFNIYIDNLRVVNPTPLGPAVALTATEVEPRTVELEIDVEDTVASSTVYMSLSPIDEAKIAAFEDGEENGLQVVTEEWLEDLWGGATYYFALAAADAKGNTSYAYAQVTTSSTSEVLYDWDEKVPEQSAFTYVSASTSINTDPAYATTGASLKAVNDRVQYTGVHISGKAGDFANGGFSVDLMQKVTKDADKDAAPSLMLNGYRVWYKDDQGDARCTYQWVGWKLPDTMTTFTAGRFYNENTPISQEILARAYDIELGFEISNFANGDVTVYIDNVKLLNASVPTTEALEEKVAEMTSPFELTTTELMAAQDEGLLTDYEPTVNYACLHAGSGRLAISVSNPDKLTETMEASGYYISAIGAVMLPQQLLANDTVLTLNTPQALILQAALQNGGADNSGYSTYMAMLNNATDYAFVNICTRAFVTYQNESGDTITLYSHNTDGGKCIENGVLTRSPNMVARLTAQNYYDGGYHGDIIFAAGESFLNKKSYATTLAFVQAAYEDSQKA